MSRVMKFVFPVKHYAWWALLCCKWLNICIPTKSRKWIPCFSLLVHSAFSSPIELFLSKPKSSLTFAILILFPITWGYWIGTVWYWVSSAKTGPEKNIYCIPASSSLCCTLYFLNSRHHTQIVRALYIIFVSFLFFTNSKRNDIKQ